MLKLHSVGLVLTLTGATLAGSSVGAAADRSTPTLTVHARTSVSAVAPGLMGANHRYLRNGYHSWDPSTNRPVPNVVRQIRKVGIETMRFPGGSLSNMYDWKKAIGPVEDRPCQIDARRGHNGSIGSFGIDEHMKLSRLAGSDTMITIPYVTETPGDAADLVEYMNARVGQNPNGGIDWALEREKNQRRLGEPVGPYGISMWSVGNEPYLAHERFWMSDDSSKALRQYLYGDIVKHTAQLVGRGCSTSPDLSEGTGGRHQSFRVLYPPIRANSQTITVGGAEWTEVDDLTTELRRSNVYTLDDSSGRIQFGDGRTTGAAPPEGANIRASYAGVHKGYLDFARAMHRVDPSVDVCSEWGQKGFIQAARNERYDCLAAHAYSFLHFRWRNARQGHDAQMIGEERSARKIIMLKQALRRATGGHSYLMYSEYGVLSKEAQPEFLDWESSVSDGLYMVSQLTRFVQAGISLAVGGAVTAKGNRAWLGAGPDYKLYAPAQFMQMVKPMIKGKLVRSRMTDGPLRVTQHGNEAYQTLRTLVTRVDGKPNILLINRDPASSLRVRIKIPEGRYSGKTRVWETVTDGFADTRVNIRESPRTLANPTSFLVAVPAHSMMRIQLQPRR